MPSFVVQSKQTLVIYVLANFLGLFLFLASVEAIDHNIKLEERDFDFGDSLNFMETALPIFGVSVLLNFGWIVMAVINAFRHRRFLALVAAIVVIAIWVISIKVYQMSH